MPRQFTTPVLLDRPPTDPAQAATKAYVDGRAAVPGATIIPVVSGVGTPEASAGKAHHRLSTGANVTIAAATGSVDTQRLLFEITATAAITITLDSAYEIGGSARTRSIPVRSGATAYIVVINRSGTLRLLSIDDGG